MELIKSDGQNLICAPNTFFNSEKQTCTGYPYSSNVSMVTATVSDAESGGYRMRLDRVSESPVSLPGRSFQPPTDLKWSVDDAQLSEQAANGNTAESFSFDLSSV